MTDLDDLFDDDEVEETTLDDKSEGEELGGLFDGDEIEAPPPIPPKGKKKASKKKASKKKASKKKASKKADDDDGLGGLFDEEEEAKPKRKKKASRKPAAEPEAAEPAAKPKRKKKKVMRKPRSSSDPLTSLTAELSAIADDAGEKSQLAQLKADLRAAKQLSTKLNRFAKKAVAAAEGQEAHVEALEAKLDEMN